MKHSDIFIGTIKKCLNVYWYKQYGGQRYSGDFQIGGIESGHIETYADIVDTQAVLIRINENQYIQLNSLTTFSEELMVELGRPIKTINTYPSADGELFVEKNSLRPYFDNTKDKSIKVKSLKKTVAADPRFSNK